MELTPAQFAQIEKYLPTHRGNVSLSNLAVLNAILYVAEHGCKWRGLMCGTLGVSRGGFYTWLDRPRSQRELADEALGKQVKQSFVDSDRTYGARRVWHDLLAHGFDCGLHRIERLM